MPPTDAAHRLQNVRHNPLDPNPWLALYLDSSVPLQDTAKANLLMDVASPSRQFLLPLARPFCRLAICIFKVVKTFVPNSLTSAWLLHHFDLCWLEVVCIAVRELLDYAALQYRFRAAAVRCDQHQRG